MQPTNLFQLQRYDNDVDLSAELKERGIALTPDEVRKIADMLGRNPSIVELYLFNGQWSEHCSYKSSRPLLKKYLPTTGPTVMMGPGEDAGILLLHEADGKKWGLVVAHESHNHPSQVLPVEGAATGIGGIVRDVNCMGGKLIGLLDCLRFGDPNGKHKERTRWIMNGVVQGIMEYGNALGVPNLGGDVAFNRSFDDNCLVNVLAVGIIEESDIIHSAVPEEAKTQPYDIILIGKPTDFSGFGGAAFASEVLDEGDDQKNLAAIQVHDPFLENVLVMQKANHAVFARAKELGHAIGFKDLGAAGLACASAELGEAGGVGIALNLDHVHTALDNLLPEVVCLAETQERFLLACPTEFSEEVLRIYNEDWELSRLYQGAGARVIGRATDDKMFSITSQGELVTFADIEDITKGILYDRKGAEFTRSYPEPEWQPEGNLGELVLEMLSHPSICSRAHIFEHYDTEVQGNTMVRSGEADAGVIVPLSEHGYRVGVTATADGTPIYGRLNPYWGGATAVAEAVRNTIAVGAEPLGLTDCLNFGNPTTPEAFWQMEESIRGLADAANKLTLPSHPGQGLAFVSGNVSLYNESVQGVAIDPSPIVGCFGKLKDASHAITPALKEPGNVLYLVGERREEFGGSVLHQVLSERDDPGAIGGTPPTVDFEVENRCNHIVLRSIQDGIIRACHDISEGGLVVALAEMTIMGRSLSELGMRIDPAAAGFADALKTFLFSESGGYVVEVEAASADGFEERFNINNLPLYRIGEVTKTGALDIVSGADGDRFVVSLEVARMREAWKSAFGVLV